MTDIILHHYPTSPFAEKIRLALGYKKLAWKSVIIPSIMPKPDVLALTGGYRKTPLLQIGSDVYCDTALICEVLEHLQPKPALYPAHLGPSPSPGPRRPAQAPRLGGPRPRGPGVGLGLSRRW